MDYPRELGDDIMSMKNRSPKRGFSGNWEQRRFYDIIYTRRN